MQTFPNSDSISTIDATVDMHVQQHLATVSHKLYQITIILYILVT